LPQNGQTRERPGTKKEKKKTRRRESFLTEALLSQKKSSLQRDYYFRVFWGSKIDIFFTHTRNKHSLLLKYIHTQNNASHTQGGRISLACVCVFLSFLINRSEVKSVLLFKEKLGK